MILQAEANKQEQILKAQATVEAMAMVTKALGGDRQAAQALQFLLAQKYMDMGQAIGNSESSKVMFMDPRNILSTLEGMRGIISETQDSHSPLAEELAKLDRY